MRAAIALSGAALLAGALIGGTALAQEKKLVPVTYTLNWYPQAEHGGLFHAKADGIYERYGLDVTIRPGGPQVNIHQLLAAGQTDFIMGTAMRTLNAQAQGVPIVTVFASFQKDPQTLVTHVGVGHDKLQDLKGKPIRLPAIARTNYWPWLKSKFGFSDEQIRGFEPGYAALGSDKMLSQQGFVTNDMWNARKVGLSLQSLLLADYGWANYATTIDVTEKTIRERPEIVRAFVRATSEGWKAYLQDPTKAHAAIKQANPQMDPDLMAFSHQEMKRRGILDSGDAAGGKIGIMTDARWEQFTKEMQAAGALPANLEWRKAYTLQFVKDL
ncbi:MAG TPA: ABC transporter substrate-binding protein [Burkholderiales bacterium]|nr:ABC transporter substrate-binding protein [Burkholderiales bacterium]